MQSTMVKAIRKVLGGRDVLQSVLEENIKKMLENKIREQRQDVLAQDAERDGKRQRIEEMSAFLQEQVNEPLVYDEQVVRRLVEKVTVYKDRLMVEFKWELEIAVER